MTQAHSNSLELGWSFFGGLSGGSSESPPVPFFSKAG
jgi:hypothetical protein